MEREDEIRLFESDHEWEEINQTQMELCWLMNPSVHFNMNQEREFIPELEWNTEILDHRLRLVDLLYNLTHPFEAFVEKLFMDTK